MQDQSLRAGEAPFDPSCGGRIAPEAAAHIAASYGESHRTRRSTAKGAEDFLYQPLPVLDHGFVRLVDYMGDDAAVVQAARISYGAGTKKIHEDRGLIRYLLRHGHTTPFEMCEAKFHVFLPLFVAREWVRHRTASINEYSGRYSVMPHHYYVPQPDHMAAQSTKNRQGRGDVFSAAAGAKVADMFHGDAQRLYAHYEHLLNTQADGTPQDPERPMLAREIARMNLSVNFYTEWYWKIDLHNLMHFLALRADPYAQYEIRVYAQAILDIMKAWVPLTYEAFLDYRKNAVRLSAGALNVLQKRLAGEPVTYDDSGLAGREWTEMNALFPEAFPVEEVRSPQTSSEG